MVTSLAEPLARALDGPGGSDGYVVDMGLVDVDDVLAALRADPETLAALAEALHDLTPVEQDGGVPDVCNRWPSHERDAAALADVLFGAKP